MLMAEVYVPKFNLVEKDPSYFQSQELMQSKASTGWTSCLSQLCKTTQLIPSFCSPLHPPHLCLTLPPPPPFTVLLFGAEVKAKVSLLQR